MPDQPAANGRLNLVGWIAGPLVGTVLGVIVSEFKNVSDHANRISILETSVVEIRRQIDAIDKKLDRLIEFHNGRHP
jgi:hypothetical protein